MGLYNVVASCVVGSLHYVRPTTQPIEVDDEAAGPLVDEGCLEPYRPGVYVAPTLGVHFVPPYEPEAGDDEPPTDPPPPRRPRPRGKG